VANLNWITWPDNYAPPEPEWLQGMEREIKNCPGHLWALRLEDEGTVQFNCERCPAGIDDLYPDGHEMIYFQGDGFQIDSGTHDLADDDTPRTIPVNAHVVSGYNYWGEYDAEIVIEPRST
jgi:hypothetical protein